MCSFIQILNSVSNHSTNMLGAGLYVSHSANKAVRYGDVIFRLLVYPGRVCKVDRQGHPLQKDWRREYGSAWVPPNCGMVPSNLPENCLKSPKQVRILGVSRGFRKLPWSAQQKTHNDSCRGNILGDDEDAELTAFLQDQGLLYHKVYTPSARGYMFDDYPKGAVDFCPNPWRLADDRNCYWTRSWDDCYENLGTGRVLMWRDTNFVMSQVAADGDSKGKYQKWKFMPNGSLRNKGMKELVDFLGESEDQGTVGRKEFDIFTKADYYDSSVSDNSSSEYYCSSYDSDSDY